jgi:hypothetical protein
LQNNRIKIAFKKFKFWNLALLEPYVLIKFISVTVRGGGNLETYKKILEQTIQRKYIKIEHSI